MAVAARPVRRRIAVRLVVRRRLRGRRRVVVARVRAVVRHRREEPRRVRPEAQAGPERHSLIEVKAASARARPFSCACAETSGMDTVR